MLEWVGTLFTSILSGGLTGLAGVAVQRFADFQNKKLDLQTAREKMAHEVDMKKVDLEIMQQEWAARAKIAVTEGEAAKSVAEDNAFAASYADPKQYSEKVQATPAQAWMLVILDFIRGIVRPGLTIYLCVLTTLIYWHAHRILAGQVVSPADALSLVKLIVGTVLYLCTTCLLWWFGVRNKQPAPKLGKS